MLDSVFWSVAAFESELLHMDKENNSILSTDNYNNKNINICNNNNIKNNNNSVQE